MNNYWNKRQNKITDKNIKETEKQLVKYYQIAMDSVINDFEATLDKLLATQNKGKPITPADLYKLDKYWKMQEQLNKVLQKLGDKQVKLYSKKFVEQYEEIYKSIALESEPIFNTISTETANQMINSIWCADGKTWSQRIWDNTNKLKQTLNDGLIECVVTGKKTSDLNKLLQKRFDVSFHRADTIIRTEIAHIQTQASCDRYKDYGITKYKFLADADERTCDVCGKLDGKEFYLSEMQAGVNAPPMHPNDRCTIVPVIE